MYYKIFEIPTPNSTMHRYTTKPKNKTYSTTKRNKTKKILFITGIWPQRSASAAGVRTEQMFSALKEEGCEVHCLSHQKPNQFYNKLALLDVKGIHVDMMLFIDGSVL